MNRAPSRAETKGGVGNAVVSIPACEVKFHPHSFADSEVRLFEWRGQLYRGIGSQRVPHFKALFEAKVIESIVEKRLLIESEMTSLSIAGYEMVLRHRKLPFMSYPNEWCPGMFKAAALNILDLALELTRHGYTLGDAHPWNIVVDIETSKPIFVDLGSIVPITDFTWSLHDEFCRFCLYPLMLMSNAEDQLARLLMCEDPGVSTSDIRKLSGVTKSFFSAHYRGLLCRAESSFASGVPERWRHSFRRACDLARDSVERNSIPERRPAQPGGKFRSRYHRRFLEKVRADVERIKIPEVKRGRWENGNDDLELGPQPQWTAMQAIIHRLLTELKPRTLLDVGSDTGWFARMAALLNIHVVRWDRDPLMVERFYRQAGQHRLPMLPLVMDFSKPTPARGLADHWSIAATERFRSELVLALGLLHREVTEHRLNFPQIIEGLAECSTRWVVLEFVAGDDSELTQMGLVHKTWYTLDHLVSAARKYFKSVESVLTTKSRSLLLCEK
jgi:hypothetical protein